MNNEYAVIGFKEISDYEDANTQFYNMTSLSNRICSLLQGRDVSDHEMCTIQNEAGSCTTGGPLVVYIPGYEPILVGVYSYLRKKIYIHTRLKKYLTWFEDETGIGYFHL